MFLIQKVNNNFRLYFLMERPTKRLWRKIGLQKNFLQGTSHSDQSKNTLSQLQQSFIKSQCSNLKQLPETELYILQVNKTKHGAKQGGDMLKNLMNLRKQATFQQGSCETLIHKLNMSSNQENMIWEVAEDTIELINDNKLTQSNLTEQFKQSRMYVESFRMKQQKQDGKINIIETVPYQVDRQGQSGAIHNSVNRQQKNANIGGKGRKTSIDQIKIRLYGVEEKQSETNQSQHAKKIIKSYKEPVQASNERLQTLEIEPKQLKKYKKNQKNLNKLKSIDIPKLNQKIVELRKSIGFQKSFILQELNRMKDTIIQFITKDLLQQMQQLNDQIGYLYSQNGQLMTKLQEKQSLIKKHHQQYTKIQQKLTQYTQSITAEHQQKELKIIQLQNQVNKLQQKLQDFSDLETKIQSEHSKIQQLQSKNETLETQINIYISNERKLHELMDQKTFDLSAAIIKNQQLEWEINELYTKNEQLEFNFRKDLAEKIQKLQNEHFNRLNMQKSFLEKEKIKNKDQQTIISTVSRVLNESLKHINLNLIEAIHKQFNTQTNEYIDQIFLRAMTQARSSSRAYNFNKDNRLINEAQNQLSPSQSENGNSSNKNLRKTGYFGEATKATLTIRLDDIQKKFSAEIIQDEEKLNDSLEQKSKGIFQQKKTLFRGDTFSQISEQGSVQQDYAFRTVKPSYPPNEQRTSYRRIEQRTSFPRIEQRTSYPRIEQRKRSKQKHTRHQSDHSGRLELDQSITQDLQRVKLCLKQQENRNSSRQYQNRIENDEISKNQHVQNVNYSFSQMNWNAFDSNDDRSSVTTYEKSENNYNRDQERYAPKNPYSHFKVTKDRSERSDRSNSQRQDIIQKIKERVKQKLKSKQKYKQEITKNEPTYGSQVDNSIKKYVYHQDHNEQTSIMGKKEDLILADFYQRHSIKNPVASHHQAQRKMSPHATSRSPSNTRSRSPSSSSTSRVNTQNPRVGISKYTPVTGTATYGMGNQPKTPSSAASRNNFSKSMVDRPQFMAYSKRIKQTNTTATYQSNTPGIYQSNTPATYQSNTVGTYHSNTTGTYQPNITGIYQPKSGLYSNNRGDLQTGSNYAKRY